MDAPAEPVNSENFPSTQLAAKVRELRAAQHLTQGQAAKLAGYTRTYVTLIESGTTVPGREVVERLDDALNAGGALLVLRSDAESKRRAPLHEMARGRSGPSRGDPGVDSEAPSSPISERESKVQFSYEHPYPGTTSSDLVEMGDMNRRELLRLFSMVGALLATAPVEEQLDWERLDYFANHTSRLDAATVEEYAALNAHLWRVFILSRSKHITFPLVRDQLDVLVSSLQQSSGPTMYQRLCQLTSDLFQLAGEILFDVNHYTDAAQSYTLAATAGKEANAPDLWACALTRHAFIGVYERQFAHAASMLEPAARLARNGDSTLSTRHWVAAVQAQTFAGLGNFDACQRALDTADQVQQLQGQIHNGGWLRFDSSRLAEERGRCYVELRRPDLAEAALTDALSKDLTARRRGSVLCDLAMLAVQQRDLNDLLECVEAAVDLARQTNSGVIGRKLQELQPHLAPFFGERRLGDLSKQVTRLTGALAAR